jgi:hypothetical protein
MAQRGVPHDPSPLCGYNRYVRGQWKRGEQQPTLTDIQPPTPDTTDAQNKYAEELVRKQLARNYAFLGDADVACVRTTSVIIVSCGGVGSWVAVMLTCSGITQPHLVNFNRWVIGALLLLFLCGSNIQHRTWKGKVTIGESKEESQGSHARMSHRPIRKKIIKGFTLVQLGNDSWGEPAVIKQQGEGKTRIENRAWRGGVRQLDGSGG